VKVRVESIDRASDEYEQAVTLGFAVENSRDLLFLSNLDKWSESNLVLSNRVIRLVRKVGIPIRTQKAEGDTVDDDIRLWQYAIPPKYDGKYMWVELLFKYKEDAQKLRKYMRKWYKI
jgi:hypothetical protein